MACGYPNVFVLSESHATTTTPSALNSVSQCNNRSDAIIASPIIVITVAISVATFAQGGRGVGVWQWGKMNTLQGQELWVLGGGNPTRPRAATHSMGSPSRVTICYQFLCSVFVADTLSKGYNNYSLQFVTHGKEKDYRVYVVR